MHTSEPIFILLAGSEVLCSLCCGHLVLEVMFRGFNHVCLHKKKEIVYLCVGGLTLTDTCVAFMTFPKSKGTVSVIGTQWDYTSGNHTTCSIHHTCMLFEVICSCEYMINLYIVPGCSQQKEVECIIE